MLSYPQQEQILELCAAYDNSGEEEPEYDYDVFEFRPSISPYLLFPVSSGNGLLPPLTVDLPEVRSGFTARTVLLTMDGSV